jgi:hypothetical protein
MEEVMNNALFSYKYKITNIETGWQGQSGYPVAALWPAIPYIIESNSDA